MANIRYLVSYHEESFIFHVVRYKFLVHVSQHLEGEMMRQANATNKPQSGLH